MPLAPLYQFAVLIFIKNKMTNSPNSPITVKINGTEYKLKITLGVYKMLSFPQEELQSIFTNGKRFDEVLKLAIYFGNRKEKKWDCLADLEKEITEVHLDDIDDNNINTKIDDAFLRMLPDDVQKRIGEYKNGEAEEDGEEAKKK